MRERGKKKELTENASRTLTGILAAAIVMSNLSGTRLIVQAAETEKIEQEKTIEAEKIPELKAPSQEDAAAEETTQEIMTTESGTEIGQEEKAEEASIEENMEEGQEVITSKEAIFASVYLQLDTNGGTCDIKLIELTPENMELSLPHAKKAGCRFIGWYMDSECTIVFDESNILWEAGSTYTLYAGYEQIEQKEFLLVEKTLQQNINGVTITVEGNMPAEAVLEVRAEELTKKEQENIVRESEIVESEEQLYAQENVSYSYDISIRYQDVEYEPYLFDEMMQVTFSFDDVQELKDVEQMEVFHIDDNENVEKIEIKEVSESEISFDADAFSTYILITNIDYVGNKNWSYGFTGEVQTFTAPVAGQYTFECYGAGINSSKGGFAKGTIALKKNETVYIYVGGQNNTFNGGGEGGSVWHAASNTGGSFNQAVSSEHGCGATDVRVGTGLETRMIVAGGGSGNGHQGGVNYSYNGHNVSHGPFYMDIMANNTVSSNHTLGQGSEYSTWVDEGDWGSGSYPNHGRYSYRTVTGGGGGGYYGGNSGYAGTSGINYNVTYQGKEYQTSNSVVENLVYEGNGKCQISLYALEADVITYYNYNMTKLGEAAGLTGSYVKFPAISDTMERPSDSKYDYTYLGWDDMSTEEIEHYTDAQTVENALNGDRNYIAVYEETGKNYMISLDSADAQSAGTTSITATYHNTLPDIVIPQKEGVIFAGYYTEQAGAGTQIYSADGKGVTLSGFDKDSIIYAHWVQPITQVQSPENKEVIAGYTGAVLTTQAQLIQPAGYVLSYQWYINQKNSNIGGNAIEAADSRRLVIPEGFPTGHYYFYCLITATSALNGQAVSVLTEAAQLSVEKGVIGMNQVEVENKTCIYDGTPKVLSAAINNSNPHTIYYSSEPLNENNYLTKGTTVPNSYIDAGTYLNYIYVTGTDFADFSGSICMTIQKAEPKVYLSSKNTAYNGKNQTVDEARVYDVNDKKMELAIAYVYFMDEACTTKTDSACGAVREGGAPLAVGTYYVLAVTQETANYKAIATKNPVMFNILGTKVRYSISEYHGVYDEKPHGLQVVNEDEVNAVIYFSNHTELTKDNYLSAGTVVPYEYTEVGNYPIYYIVVSKLAGDINEYEAGRSFIVIEEVKKMPEEPKTDNKENQPGKDNHGSNSENNQQGNGNTGQTETVKPHAHNYELISFAEPAVAQEGKALYRCKKCGHELVVTYPALENESRENTLEKTDTSAKEDSKEIEKDMEEIQKDKTIEKEKSSLSKSEQSKEENIDRQTNLKEIAEEEEQKALTEAELYQIAKALDGLTKEQIRELYEKGLLNMTQAELERLFAILRSQRLINEDQVSLSENAPLTSEDSSNQITTKQPQIMWKLLWAFLLGAAVMYLLRKIIETKNAKKQER